MKIVAGLGVLLFLGGMGYYFAVVSGGGETAIDIPLVFGNLKDGSIDMHAIIGVTLAHKSRKNEPLIEGKPKGWNDWVKTHCILKSSSGEQIAVNRTNGSKLVRMHEIQQMVGTEEFFLEAKLKPGQAYTFDYIIEAPEAMIFRCQFTAPQADEKVKPYHFVLSN
ncbi:MAG TPA: hypothetical protein PKY77_17620 [Phycisphaerae bacterium]|nr:hypothetical protein [Phycisphaerae bacterium]HRY69406.1 hypothetical protein [Phycisphaerae bacterium]HSA26273.1 hypothetical protein [Phycisphaerae bacterium]